ncbi:MAG TPA: tetratricopeptide repeat protein [Acidimicrobiales bacterium]|nr:tetratricopeptide repeat protein [Acidimicrobiales bacterium]
MTDGAGEELEEQRDVLLKSLRDLEQERAAGEIGDDDYVTLKDDYTARAAAVLRVIEARRSGPPRTGTRPPGARGAGARRSGPRPAGRQPRTGPRGADKTGRRQRSVGITVAVAFAIAAVAGISVVLLASGRDPGQPVTGSVPDPSAERVTEALSLENQGRAVDALKIYDEVLQGDPGNVEALAYRGWLLKRAGLPDEALESLDRAVAADPTFPDAHFFRGMVLYQDKDDPAAAVTEFKAFLDNNPPPDFVPSVQKVLAEAEAKAAAKTAAAAPPPEPAPEPGPGETSPAEPAPAG